VAIGIFNEAGEFVRQILVKQNAQPINEIDLLPSAVITNLKGPNGTILIYEDGNLLGTWDGTNQWNEPVANGIYHLKADSIDSSGVPTSVTRQIMVSRKLVKATVIIFNEAGEVVRHLYGTVEDGSGVKMTEVVLSSNVLQPGAMNGGSQGKIQIMLKTSGTPVVLVWDGRGDEGPVVASGHYQIAARWDGGLGEETEITRGVLVTGERPFVGKVVAAPNLLDAGSGNTLTTFQIDSTNPLTLDALIYTVTGELVASEQGLVGANQVQWDAGGKASGLYLAVVDLKDHQGLLQRQNLKLAVIR
jgi:hypothetical protein